jgi:hypothetical protein
MTRRMSAKSAKESTSTKEFHQYQGVPYLAGPIMTSDTHRRDSSFLRPNLAGFSGSVPSPDQSASGTDRRPAQSGRTRWRALSQSFASYMIRGGDPLYCPSGVCCCSHSVCSSAPSAEGYSGAPIEPRKFACPREPSPLTENSVGMHNRRRLGCRRHSQQLGVAVMPISCPCPAHGRPEAKFRHFVNHRARPDAEVRRDPPQAPCAGRRSLRSGGICHSNSAEGTARLCDIKRVHS